MGIDGITRRWASQAAFVSVALCVMATPAWAQDEAEIEAQVDRTVIELGDTFEYTLTVTTRGNEELRMVVEPDLRPFTIERTLKMPQFIVQNGVTERRLTLTYTLRTRRRGDLEIKGPVVQVGQRRIEARTLKVQVVEQGKAPTPQAAGRDDNAFVEIQLEPKRDPYVGEQITLEYALFLDTRRLDAQPKPPTEPALDAFWVEDLSDKTAGTKQITRVGSRFMERILLRKYAVFPLRAGPTTIEPMMVPLATNSFMGSGREVNVASEPVKLNVQALPQGAPADFHEGNIGEWDLLVTTDSLQARVGRPLHIRVAVKGSGQVARLELPTLSEGLPGLSKTRIAAGDPEITHSFQGGRFGGTKQRRYAITPTEPGELIVPALQFSYFDPSTGRYQTKHSAPIKVVITEGDAALLEAQAPRAALRRARSSEEELMSNLASELRSPRRATSYRARVGTWPRHPATLLAIGALWATLLTIWLWPRFKRLRAHVTPKRLRAQTRRQALALVERGGQDRDNAAGWALIQEGVDLWMSQVAGLPAGAISERELPDRLARLGAPTDAAGALARALGQCERARFSPDDAPGDAARSAAAKQAHEALRALDEAVQRGAMQTLAQSALVLCAASALVFALVAAPSPASAQQPPAQGEVAASAEAAHEAYAAQRWADAAAQWEVLRKQHPHDPTLMYNESAARARMGELGVARLLLERAALRDPSDSAIAANLDLVVRMVQIKAMERSRGRSQRLGASDEFFWWSLARRVTEEVFAVAILLSLLGAIAGTLLRRRTTDAGTRDTIAVLIALAALLALASTICWGARARIMEQTRPVVLLSADSVVREGPSPHAAKRQVGQQLVPGLMFPMEEQRDGWVHIRLRDDLSGWLPAAEVGEVN